MADAVTPMLDETCTRCGAAFKITASGYVSAVQMAKDLGREITFFCSEACSAAAFVEVGDDGPKTSVLFPTPLFPGGA